MEPYEDLEGTSSSGPVDNNGPVDIGGPKLASPDDIDGPKLTSPDDIDGPKLTSPDDNDDHLAVGEIVHFHPQSDDNHVVPAVAVHAYPGGAIDAMVFRRDGSMKFLRNIPYGPGEFGHWGPVEH